MLGPTEKFVMRPLPPQGFWQKSLFYYNTTDLSQPFNKSETAVAVSESLCENCDEVEEYVDEFKIEALPFVEVHLKTSSSQSSENSELNAGI